MLSPDKLRARRIVLQAWLFYTAALLLIYILSCAYVNVIPNLGSATTAGASSVGAPNGNGDSSSIGISPAVSLGVALILVGLAPSVPVLKRFEGWLRQAAHRLAGIPTRMLSDSDELRSNAINLERENGEDLLIPSGYWGRREHYRRATADQLTAPSDFANDIDLIFAVTGWFLDGRLKLDKIDMREQFQMLEDELRNRKDVIILELDERTRFVMGGTPMAKLPAPEVKAEEIAAGELKRRSWERIASDVNDLADDLCILLALYVEHGFIQVDPKTVSGQRPEEVRDEAPLISRRQSTRQQAMARERLLEFIWPILEDGVRNVQPSQTTPALIWSSMLILGVTLVWSYWPGVYEMELRWVGVSSSGYQRAGDYLVVAINSLVIPALIALALRDAGLQSKRWINAWNSPHWTTLLPQTLLVLAVSWTSAMLIVIAINFWNVAIDKGFEKNENLDVVRTAFETDALFVLRGSILAILIILLLDGVSARLSSLQKQKTWRASLQWALKAAAIMGLCGFIARTIRSIVAARVAQPPRPGLDAIDYGLIFYSTVYSALVGFVVIFFLSEVLLNHRRGIGSMRRPTISSPA